MSVYLINSFQSKDPTKLVDSISMDKSTNLPVILEGAPGCVDFKSPRDRISACFANNGQAQEVIDAYMDFMACRRGDSLKKRKEPKDIKHLMKEHCNKTISKVGFVKNGQISLNKVKI